MGYYGFIVSFSVWEIWLVIYTMALRSSVADRLSMKFYDSKCPANQKVCPSLT